MMISITWILCLTEIRPKPGPSDSDKTTSMGENAGPPPPPLIPQLPVVSSGGGDVKSLETTANSETGAALPVLTHLSAASTTPVQQSDSGISSPPVDRADFSASNEASESKAYNAAEVEQVSVDFDPQSVMEWESGVGTLPDSNLKFRADEKGGLQMIDENEAAKVKTEGRVNGATETIIKTEADERTCVNCGKVGLVQDFIRAGKFCGMACVTSHTAHIKSLVMSRETDASSDPNRRPGVKSEAKGRQLGQGSPIGDKRKHQLSDEVPHVKAHKSLDDENDENNRSNNQRHDPLIAGKIRGARFGRKNRVKELRTEETMSLNDSEKLSLPSSPSSSLVPITPQSALHQSIFSMRVLQHQQEPPLGWDKHSKNLYPVLNGIRLPDVLSWNPEKVAEFVNTIPGCRDIGQIFSDEVSLFLTDVRHASNFILFDS